MKLYILAKTDNENELSRLGFTRRNQEFYVPYNSFKVNLDNRTYEQANYFDVAQLSTLDDIRFIIMDSIPNYDNYQIVDVKGITKKVSELTIDELRYELCRSIDCIDNLEKSFDEFQNTIDSWRDTL